MNVENIYWYVHSFFINNQLVFIAILGILAIFIWKKPWEFLKFLAGILAIIAVAYFFSYINNAFNVGYDKKSKIKIEREEELSQ